MSTRPTATAAELYAAGVAANSDMRPLLAARRLRTALRRLGDPAGDPAGNSAGSPAGTDEPGRQLRGRILVSLALAESEQGHVEAGLTLLDQAEPLLPAAQRGALHGQRAMLLKRTGRNDLALAEFAAALAVLDPEAQPLDLARVLLNRAAMHLLAARSGPARADLARCLAVATTHRLEMLAAKAGHNLGYLDFLAGDIPSALRHYAAAGRYYADALPGMLPVLAMDRARALLNSGLLREADQDLTYAVEQLGRQRLSQDHAEAHLARAEAALLDGRPAAARRFARRAAELFARRNNPRWTARAQLVALRAAQARGGVQAAAVADRAAELRPVLERLGLDEDARVAGLLTVRALVAAGKVERAAGALRGVTARPSDRIDTRMLWRLARAEVSAAAGRADPGGRTPAARHVDAARELAGGLAELRRARGQLGALDLRTGAAVHGRLLAETGLRTALASGDLAEVFRWAELARAQAMLHPQVRPPADPDTAAAVAELRATLAVLERAELTGDPTRALRTRCAQLRRTIREHTWQATGAAAGARPVTATRTRAALDTAAMVLYLRDRTALRALVLTGRQTRLVGLGRFAVAEEALLRLRADLDAQAGYALPDRLARAVRAATRRDADLLSAAILDPILPYLGERDLVVVPTGTLITVPWHLLPAAVGRAVTVAPSASTWHRARATLLDTRTGRQEGIRTLLVAGPGIDRGVAEVDAIAKLGGPATRLTGAGATTAATLAAFPDVNVAHLAAHGRHHTDNPLFSELRLADGPVMGYDLQQAARTPPMVVLSACDLGLHDVRPGDESLGMASSLLDAGTATVVASVCRVADDAAMTVMTAYHRRLRTGRTPAQALAEAAAPEPLSGFVCFGAG